MPMANLADMYYAVGSITIANKTEGWHIDEQHSRNVRVKLITSCEYNDIEDLQIESLGKV